MDEAGGHRSQKHNDEPGVHECLDDSILLSLAHGRLNPEEVEELVEQAGDCSECWAILGEMGRELKETDSIRIKDGSFVRRAGALVAGRYQLIRKVGRGGMGEVFEAWDLELEQHIALKMVREGALSSEETLARLKREVALARQIAHPNVCRVFDWGKHSGEEERGHFLTMELLEGESLQEKLRRVGRLDFVQAVSIVHQSAEGLAAIHDAGILHRDMKSSNIMLCSNASEEEQRAVLVDFGVARELDETRTALTEDRHVIGTLDYLAPEQLQGEPWTTSSDIYALGVVFYQALTGQVPGAGQNIWKRTAARTNQAGLSTADLSRLPRRARKVVLACLAPQKERIQNAKSLCTLLELLQTNSSPLPSPLRRRRNSEAVFLLLTAGTLLLLSYSTWSLLRHSGTSLKNLQCIFQVQRPLLRKQSHHRLKSRSRRSPPRSVRGNLFSAQTYPTR